MSLAIEPIDPNRPDFAGRVRGVNIASGVCAQDAAAIEAGMDHFGVLVFSDQVIDDHQQYSFSTHFGPMETATGDIAPAHERRLSMDINDISNLDQRGEVLARDDRRRLFGLGNRLWHSDSSFKATPAKYSLLSARSIPSRGGDTEFADMRAAWDALEPELKAQYLPLVCEHSQIYSRSLLGFVDFSEEERLKWAPVAQRLVRRQAGSGRRSLFLSSHIGAIRGQPVPEARVLIRDLMEHATQPRFVYAHRWRVWDLLMWDNRALMHRARGYDYHEPRDMRRTTVADSAPTLEQSQ